MPFAARGMQLMMPMFQRCLQRGKVVFVTSWRSAEKCKFLYKFVKIPNSLSQKCVRLLHQIHSILRKMKISLSQPLKNDPKSMNLRRNRAKKVPKSKQKSIRRFVTADKVTVRKTSRGREPQKHRYLRPMSAVDAANALKMNVKVVRAVLGPRADVRP